ncbi:Uncharacterised protein [Mycobacteroides abscessus subsp. abscessus]|nr:Uncharacterised protein [Mycobacteroides abscessus subsp. abscessus]
MGAHVVNGCDPFIDDLFKFIDIEECLCFHIQAPRRYVGPFIAGQQLQQVFTQGTKEPFYRRLVAAGAHPGRLDRDPQALTCTGEMLR